MATPDCLTQPDEHLDPVVAANYDRATHLQFDDDQAAAAVTTLSELAQQGHAVEFAVGTGRIAIPLAQSGVPVHGIDFSEPMLAQLRNKEGSSHVLVTVGDMTTTRVCADATLVYLVFNTITNLRTQPQQVACFRNAANHLRSGGRFVIENGMPKLHRIPPGETVVPFDVSAQHLGFDEYIDRVNQISVSHHYYIDGGRVRTISSAFRYVWPSELDLMAQLAGLELDARWADWSRAPFTDDSQSHVSVWRKP